MKGALISGHDVVLLARALRRGPPNEEQEGHDKVRSTALLILDYLPGLPLEQRRGLEYTFMLLMPELERPSLSPCEDCWEEGEALGDEQKKLSRWMPDKHVENCLLCRLFAWVLWDPSIGGQKN